MKKDQEFRLGEEIEVGGIKWTIYFMNTSEVRCITSKPVYKKAFNDLYNLKDKALRINSFKYSTIKQFLNNNFYEEMLSKGIPSDLFCPTICTSIIANDGLRDIDSGVHRVGLITCDEYRECRKYIPKITDTWWWTATPNSIRDTFVCIVTEIGSLNFESPYLITGSVRPVCAFDRLKLKEYLREQEESVRVGDFVTYYTEESAEEVLIIYKKGIKIFAMSKTGHLHIIDESINADPIEKTGKHIDISNILEEIWK